MLPNASSEPLPNYLPVFGPENCGPAKLVKRGSKSYVLVRPQHQEIGDRYMHAGRIGTSDPRGEKAAGALHRWVGHRDIGSIKHRPPADLHRGVAHLDQPELLVVVDLLRDKLPGRRRARVVLAQVARRIDGAPQLGPVVVGQARGIAGQARTVGEQHPHILGKSVAHRVAQLEVIGKQDLAGRLRQADVSRSRDRVGALVVGDRIGEQHVAVLRHFDMPAGDRQPEIVVVLDLVGAQDDRGIPILLSNFGRCRAGRRRDRRCSRRRSTRAPHRDQEPPRHAMAMFRCRRSRPGPAAITRLPDAARSRRQRSG